MGYNIDVNVRDILGTRVLRQYIFFKKQFTAGGESLVIEKSEITLLNISL